MIKSAVTRHWPAWTALIVFYAAVAFQVRASLEQNDGHFVYPLDDTYISMAMAKNLAQHGVWGVTRHEFTSASSSIVWPLLLAGAYRVTGPNEIAPLAWNLVFATVVVWWSSLQLRRRGLAAGFLLAALLAIVFLTPLLILALIGLEHTFHTLLTLVVAKRAADELSAGRAPSRASPSPWLLLLVAGLVAARYEGLFFVVILCLLVAIRKGWRSSATVAVAGASPVAVFGIVSLANGWHFFPNSILLKGSLTHALRPIVESGLFTRPGLAGVFQILGYGAYVRLVSAPHLLFLVLLLLVLFLIRAPDRSSFWTPGPVLISLFVGASLMHAQFAAVGWLFRYEAYLVALGLFVLAFVLADGVPRVTGSWAVPGFGVLSILAFLSACSFLGRATDAVVRAPQAMRNIYEQQYQMGLFLREYYQGSKVTAVDVGAINYLADIQCLDADGLASKESFDLKLAGGLTREAIASLAEGSSLAILYDRIFAERGVPAGWIKVGSWTIPNNFICGDATVSFYSTAGNDPAELASKLRQFGARLPADIQQVHLLDTSRAVPP